MRKKDQPILPPPSLGIWITSTDEKKLVENFRAMRNLSMPSGPPQMASSSTAAALENYPILDEVDGELSATELSTWPPSSFFDYFNFPGSEGEPQILEFSPCHQANGGEFDRNGFIPQTNTDYGFMSTDSVFLPIFEAESILN